MFVYRIGRIFEYSLELFGRILTSFMGMFDALSSVAICFRSIITYFIAAMTAARDAETTGFDLAPGPVLYAFNLAMRLITSTVANAILVPVVGLFIAYAAWRLAPWGIRKLRESLGLG